MPNDLVEIGQQIVIPPPTPPAVSTTATTSAAAALQSQQQQQLPHQLNSQLSINKKDLKPNNLQLNGPSGMNLNDQINLSPSINSPSLHPSMVPMSHSQSAEIVILSSTPSGPVNINPNIHPGNMMMNNPNNMQGFPRKLKSYELEYLFVHIFIFVA